jgi:phosphoglycolate phosphatase-like HAD superfamily hydrolase
MKIFFDLDGTLIDISERHYQVYKTLVIAYKGAALGKNQYWELKRSNTPWSEVLTQSAIAVEHEAAFLKQFTQLIEDPSMLAIDTLFPASLSVLTELKENHELFLVSLRRNPENLRAQLQQLEITQYFKDILSGHSDTKEGVLTKKAEIIQTLGPLDNACIIGDTEADVVAGTQLGIPTIAVTTGIRSKDFLEQLDPDYCAESLEAVKTIIESM